MFLHMFKFRVDPPVAAPKGVSGPALISTGHSGHGDAQSGPDVSLPSAPATSVQPAWGRGRVPPAASWQTSFCNFTAPTGAIFTVNPSKIEASNTHGRQPSPGAAGLVGGRGWGQDMAGQ